MTSSLRRSEFHSSDLLSGPSRVDRLQRPSLVIHILGITLGVSGVGMLVAGAVEAIDGGTEIDVLVLSGVLFSIAGGLLWRLTMVPERIELLDVFSSVFMAWIGLAVAGATPYVLSGTLPSIDDALFEAVSGFTTTGATVLRPIEGVSKGILFWRAITQWIGGMGVIVLVVAVLPTVGSGGMDLLQAEAPGPTGERLTPRVRHTARNLWAVYVGLTVIYAVAYIAAGMSLYDGVYHSFTTLSTGGFSPYNASLGHFDSAAIEWIAISGMFLAGGSFTLWFRALRGNPKPILQSAELRLYVVIVAAASAAIFFSSGSGLSGHDGVRDSVFTVVTVVSTTGYVTADFGLWSDSAQTLLLMLMPLGAMAGSTAGGVKLVRLLAVASYAHRATLRQLHPRMVRPVRVGKAVLDDETASRVVAYVALALAAFGGGAVLISFSGADPITAFSASATTFGNVGPGLGNIHPTSDFLGVPREARLIGVGLMLLGRLEIYPVLLALVALPIPRAVLARLRR